jgi:Transcription factor WhiB
MIIDVQAPVRIVVNAFKPEFYQEIKAYYDLICTKGYCFQVGIPPHKFFTEDKAQQTAIIAEACANCSVHQECLFYALGAREEFIWGGSTDKFREMVLRLTRDHLSKEGDDSFISSVWNETSWKLAKKIALECLYIPQFEKGYGKHTTRTVANSMSYKKVKKNS